MCFSDVPEGKYNIGAAIPDNYNPTMALTYTLDVRAGIAPSSISEPRAASPHLGRAGGESGGNATSPILGIVGGLLLLGGIGLGWFALRGRKRPGMNLTGQSPASLSATSSG